MIWFDLCPLYCQGLVRPLVTRNSTLVLMRDECATVWCSLTDFAEGRYRQTRATGLGHRMGGRRHAVHHQIGVLDDLATDVTWRSVAWHRP
jgi:hypothetical protein